MFSLLALWLTRLFIMCWYSSWDNILFGTAEFFFNAFMIWLYSFQIIVEVTNLANYSENSSYAFYGAVCIFQICIIKLLVRKRIKDLHFVKETEAISSFKNLVTICISKKKENMGIIFNLVSQHRQSCIKSSCPCKAFIEDYQRDDTNAVYENKIAFTTIDEVPSPYTTGFFMKSLKILTDDILFSHSGSTELTMMITELSYYYFGNHYNSLAKLLLIEERKPGIFIQQRLYNLRKNIAVGLSKNYEKVFDREKTAITIDYLETYRKFLEKSENMIDFTVQFWSILLQEKPSAQELNRIGAMLFKSKQRLIRNVGDISKITISHTDFLLRYGLILKTAMHDYSAAEAIFRKLEYIASSVHSYTETSRFSIFNSASKVMFILATFTNESDATIIQVNTEIEKNLMYKYDEIVGRSITTLMPPNISAVHNKFVQKFFMTMESKTIGYEHFAFVKCRTGMYIPCRILKRVVPRMNNFLQVAVFMIKDPKMQKYSVSRPRAVLPSIGAILCDDSNRIIGFTKDALNILRLHNQNLNDLTKNGVIEDVFPQLATPYVKSCIKEKDGCVIKFGGLHTIGDDSFGFSNDPNATRSNESAMSQTSILIWLRYVEEIYSESEKCSFIIFSELNPKSVNSYSNQTPGRDLLFEQEIINEIRNDSLKNNASIKVINQQQQPDKVENFEIGGYADNESIFLLGDNRSVSGSVTSDSRTQESNNFMRLTHYLHEAEMSRDMPTSIKRLTIGIITVLIGIISIIRIFHIIFN